jgi:hypothetical protein
MNNAIKIVIIVVEQELMKIIIVIDVILIIISFTIKQVNVFQKIKNQKTHIIIPKLTHLKNVMTLVEDVAEKELHQIQNVQNVLLVIISFIIKVVFVLEKELNQKILI